MYPKFDPTGVRTHDLELQIMTAYFMSLRRLSTLLFPSVTLCYSVIESMMETLEGYVLHLEDKVEERTSELAAVNQNMENLLHKILPPIVATKLSQG